MGVVALEAGGLHNSDGNGREMRLIGWGDVRQAGGLSCHLGRQRDALHRLRPMKFRTVRWGFGDGWAST